MVRHLMEHPTAYRLWQAPFAGRKLAPFLGHVDPARLSRVLDVGCGPGTNTRHFLHCDYLGIDINPAYVESAERRFGPRFKVADVRQLGLNAEGGFDCILVNSILHHLSDEAVDNLLAHLATMLATTGVVHVLDLILPERASLARFLARMDRGSHPRPLAEWQALLSRRLSLKVFEPYPVGVGGVVMWSMLYCQGTRP